MASKTSQANIACIKIGSELITNLNTDNDKKSRTILALYDHVRDSELAKHYWKFAKARVILAAETDVPAFGWSYQYQLPADFLRVFRIRNQGNEDTTVDQYDIEGQLLLCNIGDGLYLEYIKIVDDENKWHPLFREAHACKLAKESCEVITQSNTKITRIDADYKIALAEAKRINAVMLRPQEEPESPYITVRN